MKTLFLPVLAGALLAGAPLAPAQQSGPAGKIPLNAADYDFEVARAWGDLLYGLIRSERQSPPVASRTIGYFGVALYEAVRPGIQGAHSLSGQLNGFAWTPSVQQPAKLHWPSAANAAAAAVLRGLYAAGSASTLAAIDALEADFELQFNNPARPIPPPLTLGAKALGRDAAAAVLAWASTDGFTTYNNCPYTPPVGEGLWVPTPPGFLPPLQPCWGDLRPFLLTTSMECDPGPHPHYGTNKLSFFFGEGSEVCLTVNQLSQPQLDIALFWADNPAQTGTPPGHWVSILGQVCEQQQLSLDVAVEGYARIGISVADAFIACWETKYVYNLLRPITYIHQSIDPLWTLPLTTPPFPEYTSGHSVQSGSTSTVLTDLLGEIPFTDNTHANLGYAARSFPSFTEAAEEAALSRLYGGIHFRSAINLGLKQGRCIGNAIINRVRFR